MDTMEFFALMHHETAKSGRHWLSPKTLSSISASTKLYCSMRPLLQGDSPVVVFTVIQRDSAISMNLLSANSPPLSVKNFSGTP